MSYSDEVSKCFEENPDILHMSPVKLAEWFYIQGILYQRTAQSTALYPQKRYPLWLILFAR